MAAVARLLLCNSVSCFTWKLTSWPRAVAITAVAVVARRTHAVRAPPLGRARYAYRSVLLHRIFIKTTRFTTSIVLRWLLWCVRSTTLLRNSRDTPLLDVYRRYLGHNQSKCCYLCRCVEFRSPRYARCLCTTIKRFLSFAPCTVVLNFEKMYSVQRGTQRGNTTSRNKF